MNGEERWRVGGGGFEGDYIDGACVTSWDEKVRSEVSTSYKAEIDDSKAVCKTGSDNNESSLRW